MKKRTAALVAIIAGFIIFGIKLISYFISNSVALLSDALESIINILASTMMLFSVYVSEKPPDESHKYGHQKIEDVSSSFEGFLIIIAALFIISTAVNRIFEPVELLEIDLAILISVIATGMNAGVSLLLTRTARESGSIALEGDAKHLLSDVISTVGVWCGLIIVQITGWQIIDSLLALIVAIFIIRIGGDLILRSARRLMDQSSPEAEKTIRSVLESQKPDIIEFHDLKTRRQGNLILAEVHVTVEDSVSVKTSHNIIDRIDKALKERNSNIEIIVHVDPRSELES